MANTNFQAKLGNAVSEVLSVVKYPLLRQYILTDSTTTYYCYAKPGAQITSEQWFIARVGGDGTVKFPYFNQFQLVGFVWPISTTTDEGDILDTIKNYPYDSGDAEGFEYDFDFNFS